MRERTCGEIIEPFIQALQARPDLPTTQIIGGNGSAALLNEHTVIDLAARTIQAPSDCDLPKFRPDKTLRDMDTLVLSTDQDAISSVKTLAERSIGDQLKISIFGLKPIEVLNRQRSQPLRSVSRVFLADRYVSAAHDEQGRATSIDGFKALYPFQAPIGSETFETFHLSTRGAVNTPTAHPGATILNYLTRSISGLRAKDLAKVAAMAENVLTRYPAIREWIHDGPGKATLDLARVLHTLSEPRRNPRVRRIGTRLQIVPYTLDELLEHPGLMASTLSHRRRRTLIELSCLKSRLVGVGESSPTLVTFWQKHIEDRLSPIIHDNYPPLRDQVHLRSQ